MRTEFGGGVDTGFGNRRTAITAMTGLTAGLAGALAVAAAFALSAGEAVGGGRFGGRDGVLAAKPELTFEVGDLLFELGNAAVALLSFAQQPFVFTAKALQLALRQRAFRRPNPLSGLSSSPQTSRMPGLRGEVQA